MKLRYVTLTGADESVPPSDLLNLSARYPFVEWGILFSQKRTGNKPRYPGWPWVRQLVTLLHDYPRADRRLNLSAHLCGAWVDNAMEGILGFPAGMEAEAFQRFQLNFGSKLGEAVTNEKLFAGVGNVRRNAKIIFGGDYSGVSAANVGLIDNSICPLMDASGGRGISPDVWPDPIARTTGYAGGIGPDNVVAVLHKLKQVVGITDTIWIDMESSLRTVTPHGDVFDMLKCEAVLQACEPFVN